MSENFRSKAYAVIVRCKCVDCKYEHIWHRPENLVNLRCPECGDETTMTPTTDICHLPYGRAKGPSFKGRLDRMEDWDEPAGGPECQ